MQECVALKHHTFRMPHIPLDVPLLMNMTFLCATSFIFEARFGDYFCPDAHLYSEQREHDCSEREAGNKHMLLCNSVCIALLFEQVMSSLH